MTSNPIAETIASLMPRAKAELTELVAFQSVADEAVAPRSECEAAANWVADALRAEGFQDVALLDTPDGSQSVYGLLPGPEGARTVLLYAHYDVQPKLDEAAWVSPPFELTERDGRWYGRGAADCKGGFIMHLLALRALKTNGGVPVNVKVIVEGSEEQGTGGLERYAEAHPELLTADAIVIGDTGNFRVGLPTVTATLRGMTMIRVQIDTLEGNLHSGQFGGAAPDALAALIRVLDSLRAADGSTVIDGLPAQAQWDGLQYPEDEFRKDARVLAGVSLTGNGTVADRIWARPAVTVIGIDCHPVAGATPPFRRAPGPRSACACRPARTRPRRPSCCSPTSRSTRRGTPGSRWSRWARARPSRRTSRARRTPRWPTRCVSPTRARRCRPPAWAARSRCATRSPRSTRRRRSCSSV